MVAERTAEDSHPSSDPQPAQLDRTVALTSADVVDPGVGHDGPRRTCPHTPRLRDRRKLKFFPGKNLKRRGRDSLAAVQETLRDGRWLLAVEVVGAARLQWAQLYRR